MIIFNLLIILVSLLSTNAQGKAASYDAQAVLGLSEATNSECLIELSPGVTMWVTEEEKWAIRRVCRL